jgi:hypothetical protein
MTRRPGLLTIVLSLAFQHVSTSVAALGDDQPPSPPPYRISLDPGHPWRPPFGLDRIGRPILTVVEAAAQPDQANYLITAYTKGKQGASYPVSFPTKPPYSARVTLEREVDELVFSRDRKPPDKPVELARQAIRFPDFEAESIARPDEMKNPVDLGTILVPSGWLLLGPGQTATLETAAISRTRDWPRARLTARFESAPAAASSASVPLHSGVRASASLQVPQPPARRDRDVLSVVIDDGDGHELWNKKIPVMLVHEPPRWPRFGASYEKLRFDAPISVRDPSTGRYSSLGYDDAWNKSLHDIVVWLPNGSRFVFWRGSSYIPFWAGRNNTGACYEWAEIISQPKGAVDCVEPLMDKELRYGKVEIVEATSAQIHVRWTYQSTDFEYKVWGDQAVEDYYFYPDGFGTRVLTLKSDPKNDYELSEFIILTPAGAYPFDVLPERAVDALFLDGRKHDFRLPNPATRDNAAAEADKKGVPAIYRLRLAKNDDLAAIYFNPNEIRLPPVVFAPFSDAGQIVTPCYWGSHWPLARGNSTGSKIDDRIWFTPCHNSVMSWGGTRPEPIQSDAVQTLDTLGRSRPMVVRRWAWLIGMTDADDAQLRDRARSFAAPPDLDLVGARPDFAGYCMERRAMCLEATARDVQIRIKPKTPCVNPVFEFAHAPRGTLNVMLSGQPIDPRRYAWDGRTLWLDATIDTPAELQVIFSPIQYRPR